MKTGLVRRSGAPTRPTHLLPEGFDTVGMKEQGAAVGGGVGRNVGQSDKQRAITFERIENIISKEPNSNSVLEMPIAVYIVFMRTCINKHRYSSLIF